MNWTNNSPNSATFKVGTYSDTATNYALGGNYNPSTTEAYVSGSGIESGAATNLPFANRLKIVITAVDSTTVRGTFSGVFYLNGDLTLAKKTITDGDFYVPWKK